MGASCTKDKTIKDSVFISEFSPKNDEVRYKIII